MRTVWIAFIALIVILGGAAAYLALVPGASDILRTRTVIEDPAEIDQVAIAFVNHPYKDSYDMTRIAGYVDNISDKTIKLVEIEVQLLDDANNREELVTYTVEDVPPGRRKTFDANAGTIGESRSAQVSIVRVEVLD